MTGLSGGAAGFIVAAIVAAALSPSLNAMAATTVNDFYRRYIRPDADDATLLRVSKRATVVWGIAQIGVALGAQWMERSVLDAGLSVLSLAAGPVLGAFLVGVLTRRVGRTAMLVGMAAGVAILFVIWKTGAVAWTWYAFIGAAVTCGVALVAEWSGRSSGSRLNRQSQRRPAACGRRPGSRARSCRRALRRSGGSARGRCRSRSASS